MKSCLPLLLLVSAHASAEVHIHVNAPTHGDVQAPVYGAGHYPCPPVEAEVPRSYSGIQYSLMRYDHDELASAKPQALTLVSGYQFDDYFALEGRVGTTIIKDDISDGQSAKVDYFFGGYLKGGLANRTPFTPYALFGVTRGRVSPSPSGSKSATSLSYGGGISLASSERFSIALEYVSYLDGDRYDLAAASFGFQYRY
ncbi:outer membrane beta-barrel protein [Ferrimonas marina]|uniref:Outer membrane protein beta-barrel domain-containing protein n=1 Tax=Ferrimonas marina TaxID=299255 RepID=A0A1M5RZK8_9GAMM|nr:outer membrane beta-barrel protein [Ferrimonas marina]SHH31508.1 Outer membrane protein beta-barrel domain-containing protein [Ferrimonas marina]